MNIKRLTCRAKAWLRYTLLTGDETRFGLWEKLAGRKYYFVVLHDETGTYLCSTIFLLRKVADDYAFKEGGYVIAKRSRLVLRRVISKQDMLAGRYRPSYKELRKTYGL